LHQVAPEHASLSAFAGIDLKKILNEILKRVQQEQTLRIGWRVWVGARSMKLHSLDAQGKQQS
jgi:hypothetical protein